MTKMFEGLFQPIHLLIILVIALVVFGPKKLPELGASLGKAIREFKNATADREEAVKGGLSEEDRKAAGEESRKEDSAKSA